MLTAATRFARCGLALWRTRTCWMNAQQYSLSALLVMLVASCKVGCLPVFVSSVHEPHA